MLSNFITASKDTPSRSGLYANGLPGVTLDLLDDLTKDEQEDWEEFWGDIYTRSITNFVGDVQGKLADKFNVDLVLLARETSAFLEDLNAETGNAGIKLSFPLPKYGVLHVADIEVYSDGAQAGAVFTFYEENDEGKVLYTKTIDLTDGLNTINIDRDFSADEIFIGFDPESISIYKTKNRYFDGCHYISSSDTSCLFKCNNFQGGFSQVNGGGINAIYNAKCSIEKYIEDNRNIFKDALWYRIGLELIRERIFSDRFNRWTTMSVEDAEKKEAAYSKECELKLNNAIRSLKMREDPICFTCKSTVYASYQLP